MKLKKFIYTTFLPKFVLSLSIGKEIKTNNLLKIYKPGKVTNNVSLNNYIENLWNNKDYVKLASLFKEDSSLLSKEQQETIFFQLTQKLYANIEYDFAFAETKTFTLDSFPDEDREDVFLKPSGFLLILKSNPDFLENYKKYLQKNHAKFSNKLPLYISMNHFYYDTTHPLFFNYLEQVDKIKSIYNLVNMSDLNTKTQNVLSVIVLSLNKITSNNFIENLDDNVQLKLEDNQKSLEGLTFYYKLFRQIYNKKNETNFEHQNRVDLISIPPTALISTLYSNIIEHNLSNPDKIMPVPLIFTAAYYISKKMDNINFELSEKEYNTCLKANEAYILMYKDDEIMTNQEHISKFFKQNLYCFNHQNNNFKNLSHSDYLQLIKINNNEKGFEDNHQISNLMKTITNQNSEIDLSSLNQSLNILSEMDENNKILKNEEISKFIENTKKTITSILDNYIICNNNISTGISNKNLLEEPIKLIYESISNTYNTLNEQNLSSFINHSKQQKKSP